MRWLLSGALLASSFVALGARESPGRVALSLLTALPTSKDAASAELRAKAQSALDLAAAYRKKSEARYTGLAEETALEWAEAATALERAKATESTADELERELTNTETKLARARALLEQAQARKGRAQAQLAALEAPSTATPATPAPPQPSTPPKATDPAPPATGGKP